MDDFEKDDEMKETQNENIKNQSENTDADETEAPQSDGTDHNDTVNEDSQTADENAAEETAKEPEANVEENTTYHYAYKKSEDTQQGNASNPQQNNYQGNGQNANQQYRPNNGQPNGSYNPYSGYSQQNYNYTGYSQQGGYQQNGYQYGGYNNPYGNYYNPQYQNYNQGPQPNPGQQSNNWNAGPQTPPQNGNANVNPSGSEKKAGKTNKAGKGTHKLLNVKSKTFKIIAIILACCIVIAGVGIGVSLGTKSSNKTEEETTSNSTEVETQDQGDVATVDDSGNYTVAGIADKCIESCVGITVYTQTSNYSYFFNYGNNSSSDNGSEEESGEGSGILMLEDNGVTYVLTCAHVISDGSSFVVTLNDGSEYDASVVAYDSQTDIGVLSIKATGLSIAEFGDSSQCTVGEQVVAIGCPGGLEFMNSVTSGYISALDRPISSSIGYDNECIQTDAAINPGNSGGALFNMQGQVIGINSSKIASAEYEGMGFAVPSNTAISTANSLIKNGYVAGRAKIGITYTSLESYSNSSTILSALAQLGYKDADGTMVINEVSSESDLADKDIQQYDMIVAVNGQTMTSTDIMTSILAESAPGDTITLTIARIENNNSINTFDVKCKLIESKD